MSTVVILVVGLGLGFGFSVWLVSGYAHVFVLLSVVIVPCPFVKCLLLENYA